MRSYELFTFAFFAFFVVAAWGTPLRTGPRVRATCIGALGMLVVVLLPELGGSHGGALLRNLAPAGLLLVGYWQTGQFMVGADPRFQARLERFDRRWSSWVSHLRGAAERVPILAAYLELSYFACYPVVPLGVLVLHLGGRTDLVESFWLVVLPATFATHALTTVFQSNPPWMADGGRPSRTLGHLRSMNRWITDHASIRVNSFPSGHVASALAVALVLLGEIPVAGVLFLCIAGSIGLSSLVLAYHYLADVTLGAGLAVLSWLVLG